jgi:prefoldin subunit 5
MGLLALPFAVGGALVRGLVDTTRTPMAVVRLADNLGRLAEMRPALERLAAAAEGLPSLPVDEVLARVDALSATLDRIASAEESLARLATLDETLIELAGAREALVRLSEAAGTLDELAGASRSLPAIAAVGPSLDRLAGASPALEQLARSATVLPAIAANSRTLHKLPDRMTVLEETMDRLEASVRVLAEATAPLQGTTARLGRLVDRLPERRRRDDEQ